MFDFESNDEESWAPWCRCRGPQPRFCAVDEASPAALHAPAKALMAAAIDYRSAILLRAQLQYR